MNAIAYLNESAAGWERSLYTFLADKERRSGSMRTVAGYCRMLNHFFGSAGHPPDRVTGPDVSSRRRCPRSRSQSHAKTLPRCVG